MTQLEAKVHILPDALFQNLSGEAVILNVASGKYYGLNEVGTRLWELLAENDSLQAAHAALLDEYEVDEDRLRSDLLRLVDEMAAHGLVAIEEPTANAA